MSISYRRLAAIAGLLGTLAQPALAWQERSIGGTDRPAAGVSAAPSAPKLNLELPDANAGSGAGTEIRIPGIGTLGVLPKFDLGFELLYGSNEPAVRPDEKSQPSDVQLRATLKHRF
jgi:hypothetical protein